MKKGRVKKRFNRKAALGIWSGVTAVVLVLLIVLTGVAAGYDSILSEYFGRIGSGISGGEAETADTMYFKTDYTADEIRQLSYDFVVRSCGEGAILLRNENAALPLNKGAAVSVFGMAHETWSATTQGANFAIDESFIGSLEKAGFRVNQTLEELYAGADRSVYYFGTGAQAGGGDEAGDWTLGELPQSMFTDAVKASYADYKDAAIIVLFRDDGEGGDLPRYMDRFGGTREETYLELTAKEKELFNAVKDAGFDKTVVVYHGANPLEMGFLEDYGVDACLWIGGTGGSGVLAVGQILCGEVNPSGRTVDTYAYDSFSAPAMQNFGDFRFTAPDGNNDYSYVNYAEGIYVGYRYYETRYEDAVMGRANVGSYNYADTVQFPFGYGLSYGDFTWSDFDVSYDAASDSYTATVTVTNHGAEGKDVVELYLQKPYVEGGVEKAAVELVGFQKTSSLKTGESETVTIAVERRELASYDFRSAGTYVLDAGDYYFSAGRNAHDAVNNILAAKGYSAADGMDYAGTAAMTVKFTEAAADSTSYSTSKTTGAAITNLFDDARLGDAVYLSRSNWSAMDGAGLTYRDGEKTGVSNTTDAAGTVGTHTISNDMYAKLTTTGWAAAVLSGAPAQDDAMFTEVKVNDQSGRHLDIIDLRGVEYDDPKWDKLLDQLKVSELHGLYKAGGWKTVAIESINKPITSEQDGPAGIINTINMSSSYYFQDEIVLASTWSRDIAAEYGRTLGQFCISSGVSGWYSPAGNIHRTPYSGRNFEYFSEDPYLSGAIGTEEVKAIQSCGVYCYPKHPFMNDQETNRYVNGAVATFAEEQAIREIYEKPFRMMVQDGGSHGIMTAMNRIGYTLARGHYNFVTKMVRGEWGMDGAVITDYCIDNVQTVNQSLAAGVNLQLSPGNNAVENSKDKATLYLLRESAHRVLYSTANSLAMNGLAPGAAYTSGFAVYILILAGIWLLVLALIVPKFVLTIRETVMTDEGYFAFRDKTRRARTIYFSVVGAIIIGLAVFAAIKYYPVLEAALRIS